MPGVYKEKECPKCGTKHRKRGKYCSQSCASRQLKMPEEAKAKIAASMREQMKSPERIAQTRLARDGHSVNPDDFAIGIPDIKEMPDDYDHWQKGEDW